MDDLFYRKPNSEAAVTSERFGHGRETSTYGGSSMLRVSGLSPSFEDYGEIFGSFHGSRASSIPTVNIPAVEEAEVFFDVGTSEFEYGEVFGEFDVLEFETPHEAVIDKPEGGDDDSIKESWTPVGTEHPLSDSGIYDQSLGCCEVSEGGKKGGSNVMRITYVSPFQKPGDIKPSLQVADSNNLKQDFGIVLGKENDHQTQNGDSINASCPDSTVFAVSNIVLKTKPSQPPPCLPPPIVHVQEDCMFSSSAQASASEGPSTYTSPSFFVGQLDVVSSEAAASATSVNK